MSHTSSKEKGKARLVAMTRHADERSSVAVGACPGHCLGPILSPVCGQRSCNIRWKFLLTSCHAVLSRMAEASSGCCKLSVVLEFVHGFLGVVFASIQHMGKFAADAHSRPTITTHTHSRSSSLQLIDPYWTLVPSLIEAYYYTHPAATGSGRSKCAAAVTALWSLRLSHSYLRR